ncbi:MAG TPA: dienelactone hydrolase family protein [Rhizomicrobium sp.]|nr:dienelactone hydrolase family protein [Rhizomicrobium sp.]
MIEAKVEIPAIATEALLLRPDDIADFPGVVFLTDIWGIRPANIGVAKRLAERGFAVLMPNVFHRYSRITPDGFEHGGAEERTKAMHALFAALTPQNMIDDGKAYVDFLLAQKGVKKDKAGIVGYCFTGQMAVRTAAAVPDKVAAAASFHGGFLVTDKPDSPHKILGPIKARLYFSHAVEDSSATPDQVETLEAALRDWHGAFQSEVYEGARHGWTVPGRDVYNEMQAERAFEKLVELVEVTIE